MTQSPDKHGMSAQRLQRIDRFLKERYLDTGKLPHAQILIAREGEIVHLGSQGPARAGSDRPIDERSLFRIASMTKPVTSVAFMMLVEEGKVALDTAVHHVLPEFTDLGLFDGGGGIVPFRTRPAGEAMRMVDLLRHTSGLTYGFQFFSNVDAAYRAAKVDADNVANWHGGYDLEQFIAELAKMPLEFSPGTAWNYSVSTDVLGAVIQRLSGMTLDRFFEERIFAPLGMADTFFTVPADKADRLTDCWHWAGPDKGRIIYDRAESSMWLNRPTFLSGGGGLVSTALDYHRFCQMCQNGGELEGVRLLGRQTVKLMAMNHLPGQADLATLSRSMFSETVNAGAGFGLGFAMVQDVAKTLVPGTPGEIYWGGIFSTAFFIDPVEKLHMVFMTQSSPSTLYPIRRELKTMIHAALT